VQKGAEKMTTTEAINHFTSRKLMAEALKIGVFGTYRWGQNPPILRQFQIERLTKGKLKADA